MLERVITGFPTGAGDKMVEYATATTATSGRAKAPFTFTPIWAIIP